MLNIPTYPQIFDLMIQIFLKAKSNQENSLMTWDDGFSKKAAGLDPETERENLNLKAPVSDKYRIPDLNSFVADAERKTILLNNKSFQTSHHFLKLLAFWKMKYVVVFFYCTA